MKTLAYSLIAAVIFLASCMAQHTCPTYMKKDIKKGQSTVRV